jgi:hypothetical protein
MAFPSVELALAQARSVHPTDGTTIGRGSFDDFTGSGYVEGANWEIGGEDLGPSANCDHIGNGTARYVKEGTGTLKWHSGSMYGYAAFGMFGSWEIARGASNTDGGLLFIAPPGSWHTGSRYAWVYKARIKLEDTGSPAGGSTVFVGLTLSSSLTSANAAFTDRQIGLHFTGGYSVKGEPKQNRHTINLVRQSATTLVGDDAPPYTRKTFDVTISVSPDPNLGALIRLGWKEGTLQKSLQWWEPNPLNTQAIAFVVSGRGQASVNQPIVTVDAMGYQLVDLVQYDP